MRGSFIFLSNRYRKPAVIGQRIDCEAVYAKWVVNMRIRVLILFWMGTLYFFQGGYDYV